MAQNDRAFLAGEAVNVYEHAQLAAAVEAGHVIGGAGGAPRSAKILREHPSEPGVFEVEYADGSSELVSDAQRMRHASPSEPSDQD